MTRWLGRFAGALAAAAALVVVGGAVAAWLAPARLINALVADNALMAHRDLAYGPHPRQRLDVYTPTGGAGGLPVVVFYYGGSWSSGSKRDYPFLADALVRVGFVVVVPDYRVYPDAVFPAFLDDAAAALAWTLAGIEAYGGAPARVALLGHSAGAYNAVMIALEPRYLAAHGIARSRIGCVVGLAGPYDFLPADWPSVRPAFGDAAAAPETQPLRLVDAEAPPMLLLHGLADTTAWPRHAPTLAAALRAVGAAADARLYPGIDHIGMLAAFAPVLRHYRPVHSDVVAHLAACLARRDR